MGPLLESQDLTVILHLSRTHANLLQGAAHDSVWARSVLAAVRLPNVRPRPATARGTPLPSPCCALSTM